MSDYIFVWANNHPFYVLPCKMRTPVDNPDIPFNGNKRIIQLYRHNRVSCYYSKEDLDRQTEEGKGYLEEGFTEHYLQLADEQCRRHRQLFEETAKIDFSTYNSQQLIDHLEKLLKYLSRTIGFFVGTQEEGTRYLVERVTSTVGADEAATLMLASDIDVTNQEMLDWHEVIKDGFDKDKVMAHVYAYPWIVANHHRYEDVMETLEQRYANSEKHDVKKDKEELKKKQDEILSRHPELAVYADRLQKLAMSRVMVKSCWQGTEFYAIPILATISARTGESVYNLAHYYLPDEMLKLLEGGQKLAAAEIVVRDGAALGIIKDGERKIVFGEAAEAVAQEELGDLYKISQVNELRGMVARPGYAKAKARILNANNVEQMRELRQSFNNEVLVTEMTAPNVMDIVKKAVAIVTDEGGMLSHAAVISREFGIPCIVGTHKATEVIKNGDLLEVDADKGIVKIIRE